MTETTEIEWGYNCLTAGIHHGRPEKLWNVPLLYASEIFTMEALKEIVISRIYNDAMQFVNNSALDDGGRPTMISQEWADRVKQIAEERYERTLHHKLSEIDKYYKLADSFRYKLDIERAAKLVTEDKLSPGYEPLHPHDSINMLCRIIGSESSRIATE